LRQRLPSESCDAEVKMSALPNGDLAIVGGSLAGLATGIGVARLGIPVRIFEQFSGEERGGTGLGVERDLISQLTGVDATGDRRTPELPVVNEGYRDTSTWLAIYRWLRTVADATRGLEIHEAARVDRIQSETAAARLSGSHVDASASVAIGADGYRSVVRTTVSPAHPFAPYGGFLIWRALVNESWLPASLLRHSSLGGGRLPYQDTARLVIYRVPGPDGETRPGNRAITLAWYDASRTEWLRERGYLNGTEVMGSVPAAAIDDELRAELRSLAASRWRGSAAEIIATALEHQALFGTPLAQYLPERLTNGRVGIVGDAAHVASPMVGAGFASGLEDGIAFVSAVKRVGGTLDHKGAQALRLYDQARLEPNRERVLESLASTQELLRSASRRAPV
jgi:2-polyprenyl-6-methoxyphenol hydroxylase-like FAD-dependent oxidoreductase